MAVYPTCLPGTVGNAAKFGFDTVNPVTKRYFLSTSNLGRSDEFIDANAIRGTLSRFRCRNKFVRQRVGGTVATTPTAAEWADYLLWVMGGTVTVGGGSTTYALGDCPETRFVQIDYGDGFMNTYDLVAVDNARITGSEGNLIGLELDLVGSTETQGGTFPALSVSCATTPFSFNECVFSINSVAVQAKEFSIEIAHSIDRERFLNSTFLPAILKLDRKITFKTRLPKKPYMALYGAGGDQGVQVVVTATNGLTSISFTMPKVVLPRQPFNITGPEEVFYEISGTVFADAAAFDELVVVLDSTP